MKEYEIPEESNLVGDYFIEAGQLSVMAGYAGVGKSRAAIALAVAGAKQSEWFGNPVHTKFRTMILQDENSKIRLKREFSEIDCEEINEFIKVSSAPELGIDFADKDFREDLKTEIESFKPDLFVLDPFSSVTEEDTKAEFRRVLVMIRRFLHAIDPTIALMIVTHNNKPRGETQRGRGLMHSVTGSLVLTSMARTVFSIMPASDDTDDERVVFTVSKCNNGKAPPDTAWIRGNGVFKQVSNFDFEEFYKGNGGKKKEPKVTEEIIRELFDYGSRMLSRKEAVDELMRISGCGQNLAYESLRGEGPYARLLRYQKEGATTMISLLSDE